MNRRTFVSATAATSLAAAAADPPKPFYYHLHYFYMRSGSQLERTTAYLRDAFLPAAKRAGIAQYGFFSPVIGERSPFILALFSYPSWTAIETTREHLAADQDYRKAWDDYNNIQDPGYVRMESTLLHAFNGIPAMDVPPTDAKRAARIFELRTYESVNDKASSRKVQMFETGEAGIFRRLGMAPVFFGRALIGDRLPHLTYMLSFDDLASRERLWRAFGADPEWQKLRVQPGLSDAEIVSNITSSIVRPLPFSAIR